MQIKLLVEGGSMKPGPALSQKLGPAGIPLNKVIEQVNQATADFKGLKVPVELEVDMASKEFEVQVFSPPVSELLKRELGIQKGSGLQSQLQVANASIEQIISVAKTKKQNLLCKDLKSSVKTVIGTCGSLGVLIENKTAPEIEKDIDNGVYDSEINSEKTETSPEKRKKLDDYFTEVKSKQDAKLKLEQAAKEAEAEKKEAKLAKPAQEAASKPSAKTPSTDAKKSSAKK
jgi:large subunit ribosomal protein L11